MNSLFAGGTFARKLLALQPLQPLPGIVKLGEAGVVYFKKSRNPHGVPWLSTPGLSSGFP
jgi:hypothetical protein